VRHGSETRVESRSGFGQVTMPLRPKVRHLLDKASVKVVKGDMDTDGDSGGGKNHEAARLARNSTTPGAVTSGNYVYYKVLVNNPRASIKIHLKVGGDVGIERADRPAMGGAPRCCLRLASALESDEAGDVLVQGKSGDPDLMVGNSTCPFPTKESCTWKKAGFGDDKITISSSGGSTSASMAQGD
jgi:hypothetical protein